MYKYCALIYVKNRPEVFLYYEEEPEIDLENYIDLNGKRIVYLRDITGMYMVDVDEIQSISIINIARQRELFAAIQESNKLQTAHSTRKDIASALN